MSTGCNPDPSSSSISACQFSPSFEFASMTLSFSRSTQNKILSSFTLMRSAPAVSFLNTLRSSSRSNESLFSSSLPSSFFSKNLETSYVKLFYSYVSLIIESYNMLTTSVSKLRLFMENFRISRILRLLIKVSCPCRREMSFKIQICRLHLNCKF